MKYFAVIFAFCLAGAFANLTVSQKEKLKEFKVACIAETGVDEAVINSLKMGQLVQFDDKVNCFAACMLKKIGIMKQDGSIDEAVSRAKAPKNVPKEKVDQVINLCKNQIGSNQCATGGKVMACLLKTRAFTIL